MPRVNGMASSVSPTSLMACRRNNKTEKRKRNREYARKFKSATAGGSRRKQVVEEKSSLWPKNEENFQADVFKVTTDDDMPAYSGFDFV